MILLSDPYSSAGAVSHSNDWLVLLPMFKNGGFLAPGTISAHDGRWFVPPWGVNGGAPAGRSRKIVEKPDGTMVNHGNKVDAFAVEAGDRSNFITWGGGWGDPLQRASELVAQEITQGLATINGARSYGVVGDDAGRVDVAAIRAQRALMRAARPAELPQFNFRPDIETLHTNRESETRRPVPVQSVWRLHELAE